MMKQKDPILEVSLDCTQSLMQAWATQEDYILHIKNI